VGPCPPTAYEIQPALGRISEEDGRERGEKEYEGRRRWMTGHIARMASNEIEVARSYLDDGESANRVWSAFGFQYNLTFVLGFRWYLYSGPAALVNI
jgi:hypothetical protein